MVAIAQLVEPRIVIPVVAGSIPVSHPTSLRFFCKAKKVYGWQAVDPQGEAGVRRSLLTKSKA